MRPRVDGYHVGDIEFSAAFDIDARKVGLDLSEAILSEPNNTVRFAQVPHLGVPVHRGMTHDGLGHYLSQVITKASGPTADITGILRETRTDVVVNFLPVGSEMATKWYVEQILEAGCGFVNCIPVFIARESYWRRRFEERGLPVVGDDVARMPPSSTSAAGLHGPRLDAPASSTWAATPISTTCSSARGSSPRRSPRRTPCARS
jgi:myo-inositol-1-phosphate synthase